jgi:Glycosyltransferase family 87
LPKRYQFAFVFALALVATASTWFYIQRILKPHQVAYAAAHQQPRGNLSDLYPRWLGARELLLHRRNPYSREITLEIQQGYYGRLLDASRPDDPKDQQGFAYPAYVVFLLAPSVNLSFDEVQTGFRWLLVAFTALTVPLWLRLLQWKLRMPAILLAMVLMLGAMPVAQGIKLQQLSLIVAGMLAACAACLAGGFLFCAGMLLALATIKPQLAWPLVAWLVLWSVCDWRSRRRFVFGFALAMLLLFGGAEILLPGWLHMFLGAIREYHQYTQNQSVLEVLVGTIAGRALDGLAVLGCGFRLWRVRHQAASSAEFGQAFAVVLALTVLIVPMYAPYNQVLLLPAILSLAQTARTDESLPAFRFARGAGALILIWPWIATLLLSAASFALSAVRVQGLWPLPFYSTFLLPVFVFGLACIDLWACPARGLRVIAAAE